MSVDKTLSQVVSPGPFSAPLEIETEEESAAGFLAVLGDDAFKWAEAFCRQYPSVVPAEALGWFANAIENSADARRSRLIHNDEAFADFCEDIMSQRRFRRDLEAT